MNANNELPPLCTIPQLSRLPNLGLSQATLYRMAQVDQVPGIVRIPGRRLMIRSAVFLDWLQGNEDLIEP